MKQMKHQLDVFLTDTTIAIIAAISIFLPYIFTAIILILLTIYVIVKKRTRKLILIHKGTKSMLGFFVLSLTLTAFTRNWLGLVAGLAIMLAFLFGFYLRSIMTHELYEKLLTLICISSIIGVSCAISEKYLIPLFNTFYYKSRISAMFFHPNYFGTVTATVIIICAYKVITKQGSKHMYYTIASINVISLYLCQSMFAWVEVFIGVAVLLMILKKHRLLSIWLIAAAIAGFIILILNINLIPRLSDAEITILIRMKIWKSALEQIKNSPLIGHGFMSFLFIFNRKYLGQIVTHTHSILIDMIMNFGILGTALCSWYFIQYYITIIKICFKQKQVLITSIILAVSAAAFIHGTIDITLLWIQTLPLFLLLLSGLGAFEKKEAI